ncbi:CPBP family intramembrane metalloprotease [Streptomyces sp. NE06-03E]|uniref:CPBP family intramembrane metalloprotease n=2 Tax=Streptomyces TaxID=1883 RepID=A0ABU8A6H2_9ACTN|nr:MULTISPECIES: CPBP family intramembrane glutamic endopeptidase [unclassified Streptomyces]WSS70897.1 CPBP family intramembrane metalloprotease [Streptomyces sp. NBC_01175]WSS77913.1 CPBP family intramembrane metalloprotease [Streptomyces sp. NBC_01174]MDX3056490.1 CPBP family intramembrane metalloprotease [Streptomyces sp. NE06-03E]MDX3325883.1 CPBP family intramembrane metalloprotease [Streptomyces sp. ME02-6979-3A]MDX3431664.1 CPBP family intramembrane metalloprotease [Streptomyces sp. ME
MSAATQLGAGSPPAPSTPEPRGGWRAGMRRYPLTWFFSLAFVLSWVGWVPYILSGNGQGVLDFTFPGGEAAGQLLGVLPGAYLGPILSAFIVTAVADGRPGLRAWAGRMTKWRVGWRWWAAIIVTVPLVLVLTLYALGGESPVMPSAVVLVAFLPGLALQMVTTGVAEEPGWRDFAMPRLQDRFGPVRGTLVLGPLWGAWHLPLYLSDWGGPHVLWWTPVEFIATTIAFSFVMTWVFNHTRQALLLAMLLHTSVNNYFSVAFTGMFPSLDPAYAGHAFLVSSTAAAAVLLLATRGRLGLPRA